MAEGISVETISADAMTDEARIQLYLNVGSAELDPLELLVKLEEVAQDHGYKCVHDFINDLNQKTLN